MSLSIVVLGYQSGNALRRFANSSANKCATRSFAIKSRNAQGICFFFFFDNKKKKKTFVSGGDPICNVATTKRLGVLRNHCVLPWHRRVEERVPGVDPFPHLS